MVNGNNFSEYYFDYDLEQIGVDSSIGATDFQSPRIYFERDYRKKNLPYSLTVVPFEWLEHGDIFNTIMRETDAERTKAALASLDYESVRVIFSVGAIDYRPLLDSSSKEYKEATNNRVFSFKDFNQTGCTITIDDTAQERSGVGVIEMIKDGKTVARFVFIVNCIRRKKISYAIVKKDASSLEIRMLCKDKPQGISVSLVHHPSRLPCLKEDKEKNTVGTVTATFEGPKGEFRRPVNIKDDLISRKHIFSLAFTNDELNKYYILDCKVNQTLDRSKTFDTIPEMDERSCPYCHGTISARVGGSEAYKKGGSPCGAVSGLPGGVHLPTVYTSRKTKFKNCLYCKEDLIQYNREEGNVDTAGRFNGNFSRLLPADFMEHRDFKIAFAGSARAGKTTYISRFFGVVGDDRQVSMPMTMTANGVKPFGLDIKTAVIEQVEPGNDSNGNEVRYVATEKSWAELESQYIDRRISLNPMHYPEATSTGNYTRYPFIAEVNKKAYVSFYDIAGEDAQHSMQIRSVANGKPIGIFCIINGESDANGNSSVVSMLLNAELPANCPIAVIVTKMDNLEKAFDPNCHCLKTDYFDKIRAYDNSDLEKEINYSSEEIKAYLYQNGLLPDFGSQYRNVKFFGVSSFNFGDSIHKPMENLNARGSVFFECSSKHLELPFVWMMRQFGIIK